MTIRGIESNELRQHILSLMESSLWQMRNNHQTVDQPWPLIKVEKGDYHHTLLVGLASEHTVSVRWIV